MSFRKIGHSKFGEMQMIGLRPQIGHRGRTIMYLSMTHLKIEKELFYSFKRAEGSPSILSCSAGMAVFYREKEFDFASERIFTDFELKREAGITAVSGIAARFLYLELQFPKYICRRNFIYWQARPKLWLNFAMEGNTLESYAESVQLFSRLKIENP